MSVGHKVIAWMLTIEDINELPDDDPIAELWEANITSRGDGD